MDYNELAMHTGNEPHIEQYGYSELAMKIGSHLYVAAMVLPGLHTHEEVKVASSIRTKYSATSQPQLIIGEVEDLSNQAYVPRKSGTTTSTNNNRSTRTPIDSHALPQLVCNLREGHGTTQSPQKRGKEQSLIQLDHAYVKSTTGNKVNTVLTGVETIKRLAVPTTKKGATQYQITQLKKFVMENGFGGSMSQQSWHLRRLRLESLQYHGGLQPRANINRRGR
eukprot:1507306-Amphidinium_carterae.1